MNDPISSESILIDWLVIEVNYSRYCGDSDRESKTAIAKEIADEFVAAGIVKDQKPPDIMQKIAQFKTNHNIAYE